MNILVVNDDGIKAEGLFQLVQALKAKGDVYVCAPDEQQSAKSHSITLGKNVFARPVDFPGACEAFALSGTPADCTKFGLQFFEEAGIKIDMVYSGINMGSNLGRDTLYSGTIGAAAEAALDGYKAVAVSVDSHTPRHYEKACQLAADLLDQVYEKLDAGYVLSINAPDLPLSEVKGTKLSNLGPRYYDDKFYECEDGGYKLSGRPCFNVICENQDSVYLRDGYATITPLHFDFTAYEQFKNLGGWEI
ncbi:MAG: 5'/3'-nucleotidase SurE [Clostridia bacterium]|nr:5'/3'-nucleotidase SurE [Clostridia bacterium]